MFSRYHNRGNKKKEALSSFSPLSSDSGKFEWCRISAPVPGEIFNSDFFFRCAVRDENRCEGKADRQETGVDMDVIFENRECPAHRSIYETYAFWIPASPVKPCTFS